MSVEDIKEVTGLGDSYVRWHIYKTDKKIQWLIKQTKNTMPEKLKKHLEVFYNNTLFYDKINKLSFINEYKVDKYINTIYIKDEDWKNKLKQYLNYLNDSGIHFFWETLNKYSTIVNMVMWDLYFEYDVINQLWKRIHKKEKYSSVINSSKNVVKFNKIQDYSP